jgi:putative molybdopterin biosynthesis protein
MIEDHGRIHNMQKFASMNISGQIRWTLGDLEIDPRLVALMEAVARHGNLQGAARSAGLSYRHAWGLFEAAATQLGQPLVLRQQGRGTVLAPLGARLLEGMVDVNGSLAASLREGEARMAEHLERAEHVAGSPIRVSMHASHDLALARMRDIVARQQRLRTDAQFPRQPRLPGCAAPQKVRTGRLSPAGDSRHAHTGRPIPAVSAAERLAGGPPPRPHPGPDGGQGNPKGLIRLSDLAGGKVRFVNRQPGSGTRLCLDFLLTQSGRAAGRHPWLQPRGIHPCRGGRDGSQRHG